MLDEETWKEWLTHPCTQRVREWAKEERQSLMSMWASGSFTASFELEMLVRNSAATGACSVYEQISDMEYDLINQKDEDAKL